MYWAGCFRENLPEFYRTSGLIQLQSAGRVNNPIIDSGIGKFLPQDGFHPCAAVHISAAYKKNPHHHSSVCMIVIQATFCVFVNDVVAFMRCGLDAVKLLPSGTRTCQKRYQQCNNIICLHMVIDSDYMQVLPAAIQEIPMRHPREPYPSFLHRNDFCRSHNCHRQ